MWDSRDVTPLIHNLGTRWEWFVSFMPLPAFTHWIGSWREGGRQSWFGCFGEDTKPVGLWESKTWLLGHPAHNLIIIVTALSPNATQYLSHAFYMSWHVEAQRLHLAENRGEWWALTNTVMGLFCEIWGIPRLTEDLLAFQEGSAPWS